MATKELLDSDRVNYLIWRYLIEGNYRETAAKFQKEWRVQQPHRHFDFASCVKNYALIDVVNKGLVYQSLERDYTSQLSGSAPTVAPSLRGVFGPLVLQPTITYNRLQNQQEEPFPSSEPMGDADVNERRSHLQSHSQFHQLPQPFGSLKRHIQPHAPQANGNLNPAKRQRLANAVENNVDAAARAAARSMDVDQHPPDNHAYPSPLEGEQAATPVLRTDGPDHATQTDKVDELEKMTVYLRLSTDEFQPSVAATPTTDTLAYHRPDQNPILLHCKWNQRDPTRLAAAGTDALARIWTVSRTTSPEQVSDHVDPGWPSINLVSDEFTPNARVTAMSWTFDGKYLALATEDDSRGRIDVWDLEGRHVHQWDDFETPIIKLLCNPVNQLMLVLSPSSPKKGSNDPDGWIITILPSISETSVEHLLPVELDVELDITWMNETDFVLCIGTRLVQLRYTDGSIIHIKEFSTGIEDALTAVQYDGMQYIAAATSTGHIDIWDTLTGERRSYDAPAHDGGIVDMQWQPTRVSRLDGERLLASGGEDGTISIRDARSPDSKAKFETTIDPNPDPSPHPVLAISFTPDGAFIAGATRDRILVWKVGEYSWPRARWSRASYQYTHSPKVNGNASPNPDSKASDKGDDEVEFEDQHCLSWDPTGQRLAFGASDLLAVMNFRL